MNIGFSGYFVQKHGVYIVISIQIVQPCPPKTWMTPHEPYVDMLGLSSVSQSLNFNIFFNTLV